jgi:hypothetical protein
MNFLLELTSNCDSPNLHLPSSWDYRFETLYLALKGDFDGSNTYDKGFERY